LNHEGHEEHEEKPAEQKRAVAASVVENNKIEPRRTRRRAPWEGLHEYHFDVIPAEAGIHFA
jgi:hypothetical protein